MVLQEAEEEDSEAARVANLKGMSKLIHKMSNSISARRPQCFGGQAMNNGPTDGKHVRLQAIRSASHWPPGVLAGAFRTATGIFFSACSSAHSLILWRAGLLYC